MDINIHVRNYKNSVEVRYVNVDTGETIYDMTFAPLKKSKLSNVIDGVEKMHAGRFDDARLRWNIVWQE